MGSRNFNKKRAVRKPPFQLQPSRRLRFYRFKASTSSIMLSVVVMMRELAWKARW